MEQFHLRNLQLITHLPGIHPAVDYRVVHRVAHRQPVNAQVYFLNVFIFRDSWKRRCHNEVQVEGQPAYCKDDYHYDHHLHNLQITKRYVTLIP